MSRFYFNIKDDDKLAIDEEGLDLPDLKAVQIEAARSLVDMARHTVWTKAETLFGHRMAVEVRDEYGPVLEAKFAFEVERRRQ
jgi:hypothetical protein